MWWIQIVTFSALGSCVTSLVHPELVVEDGHREKDIMSWLQASIAMVLPNVGGIAGGLITRKAIPEWYNKVSLKICWEAFKKIFQTWEEHLNNILYKALHWYALGKPNLLDVAGLPRPLQLYALQISLNWIWTPIFFGAKHLTGALVGILAVDAAVVATTASFFEVDQTAGLLMLPYIGWLTLATGLTTSIWYNNPDYRWGPPKSVKTD
ncbi:unnamed protein product, partial [Meganyctiphanes norvegica]